MRNTPMRGTLVCLLSIPLAGSCIIPVQNDNWRGTELSWSAMEGTSLEDATSVLAALRNYYEDLSARDWDQFAANFWPGAILGTIWTPPDSTDKEVHVSTVPEFIAAAPGGPDSASIFAEWMTDAEIRVQGPLSQAWVRYEAEFGETDALMKWSGVDCFTLLFHDDSWRIVSITYAPEL